MTKKISAYINVALEDYDDSMLNHVVELMKDSLREQSSDFILEDTWKVEEKKRTLYKNEAGEWVSQSTALVSATEEILKVMTVTIEVEVF